MGQTCPTDGQLDGGGGDMELGITPARSDKEHSSQESWRGELDLDLTRGGRSGKPKPELDLLEQGGVGGNRMLIKRRSYSGWTMP